MSQHGAMNTIPNSIDASHNKREKGSEEVVCVCVCEREREREKEWERKKTGEILNHRISYL